MHFNTETILKNPDLLWKYDGIGVGYYDEQKLCKKIEATLGCIEFTTRGIDKISRMMKLDVMCKYPNIKWNWRAIMNMSSTTSIDAEISKTLDWDAITEGVYLSTLFKQV